MSAALNARVFNPGQPLRRRPSSEPNNPRLPMMAARTTGADAPTSRVYPPTARAARKAACQRETMRLNISENSPLRMAILNLRSQ